ncbi:MULTISPECIES: AfsR/SARP family transcriptional regulator [Glycomyces]|uniref:BTAD domain-containing putative transcriptional regulator n=2 Tax=Glycomyces TaxID=58113 RepID=A0A9X3PLH3_9ACTN|nr:BTAD domain-containing putative transcriptional regulator [Glycomyces lechevalierae]MDA1385991.1 BTAD domain-containing putative transcriptional regulator [Glycomyces lechevalierae]MDR7340852.1 DNA-binding SARP family transcriptional activator [Glycomyces lechevalierae]
MFADAAVFLVLGTVETHAAGRADRSWTAKPQALLALLLLKPNTVVNRDWLVDQMWGDAPPATAVSTLRTYAYRLRQRLRADERITLRSKGGGYLLEIPPDAVDAARFEALVAVGRAAVAAGDHAGGAAALREGLRMWRGPAFEGVDVPAVRARAQALDDLRLEAFEQCVRAELEAGQGIGEVSELEAEIAGQPLRESLWHTLMLALYRAGRQGEALEAYRRLHRVLDDELGIRPSAQVEELHRQILAGRSSEPGAAEVRERWTVPRQLPAATTHFTGRTSELAELDTLLADGGPAVAALSGTGGIGKSTLAFAWAHRAADHFPDGQLYCDLRGFDPAAAPVDPGEAIRGLLESLGTASESIPIGLDAQAALYRSRLAGKRVLLVLDNARDAAQVRPLLPGSATCRVLVTSRDRLSGLVVDGARALPLAELSADDARAFLRDRLRADRTEAEPEAVQHIIDACAGLPLALAVTAARAALNPRFPLAELAAALREDAHRLDALADPDPAVDLRTVLHGSYRALDGPTARLFRLLSAHPGPAFTPVSAAAAAAIPLPQAERLLTALTRLNLLAEAAPRQYAFHDLVRVYAAELAADERPDAARRVLDHYLQTAYAAARLVNPLRDPIAVEPPVPGIPVADLPDADAAMAWFTAEHPALLAAVELAAAQRLDVQCWQLAWCLHDYLHRRGRRHDQAAVWRTALDATRRLGDRAAQTRALRQLAQAHVHLKEFDTARTHLDEALALADDLGNDRAHTHQVYGALASVQGRHAESIEHNRRAIDHYRATGHRAGEAGALNSIAWVQSQAGDHQAALGSGAAALSIMDEIGHRAGQAATLDSLGLAHHRLGEHGRAVERYEQAVALYRELDARAGEAATLTRLGDVQRARGETAAARDAFKRAADLLDELGHDASRVRALLRDAG